jgi:GTPase SAR1 family protein
VKQKERFSSLRKWFYKIIVKPKEQHISPSSSKNINGFSQELDKEYSEEITKLERNKEINESKLNETLKDWLNHTKLSVAVTGASGVGKSLLINTLLETTYEEKKDIDEALLNNNQTKTDSTQSLLLSSHSLEQNKFQLSSNVSLNNNVKKKTTSSSSVVEDQEEDLDVMTSPSSLTFAFSFTLLLLLLTSLKLFFISGSSMRVGVPLHRHRRK